MPKHNKESKVQNKPYARSKQPNDKKNKPTSDIKKKPVTKSEKVKNADLTNQLDNLMDDLSSQLSPPKKKKIQQKDKIQEQLRLEEEQQRYEKTQNDMDDALGLLTRL